MSSLLLAAGCVSHEQRLASDRARCAGFGYAPDTDAFADCMMTTQRDRDRAAMMQDAQDRAQRARDDAAWRASVNASVARDRAAADAWKQQQQ